MKVWASTSGNQQVSQVNTGYIRCTGGALAAPPFKLHKRGVVYCEQMRSHSLKCLTSWSLPINASQRSTRG